MKISRTSDYSVAVLLHINELMCILPMDRQSCSNNPRSIDANNFVAYVQVGLNVVVRKPYKYRLKRNAHD